MNQPHRIEQREEPATEPVPLRSIRDIVADLSKPLPERHLRTRKQGGKDLAYIPWYVATQYLDHYAAGWSYSILSVSQIGENLVMTVEISICCLEGVVRRAASALEPIAAGGYGDAAVNAESAALRRAASKFGLGRALYEK